MASTKKTNSPLSPIVTTPRAKPQATEDWFWRGRLNELAESFSREAWRQREETPALMEQEASALRALDLLDGNPINEVVFRSLLVAELGFSPAQAGTEILLVRCRMADTEAAWPVAA